MICCDAAVSIETSTIAEELGIAIMATVRPKKSSKINFL
jgi:hypothetical protein